MIASSVLTKLRAKLLPNTVETKAKELALEKLLMELKNGDSESRVWRRIHRQSNSPQTQIL